MKAKGYERLMKKVGVCGHFGIGKNLLNGQTVRTRSVTTELIKHFGKDEVTVVDSCGGIMDIVKICFRVLGLFRDCENVIMLPAHRGVRLFTPLYLTYNFIFRRRIHYIAIGGWINSFLDEHEWLAPLLKKFDAIYVQSAVMKADLEKRGFFNVVVLYNFKELNVVSPGNIMYPKSEPYKLCTFSRVMKEKGIEDAIDAVRSVNAHFGRTVYTLDIFGQVDAGYEERFSELKKSFPSYISYGGTIEANKSVEILKSYFALLFPTYYKGEGFAGTLIYAMSAGVPVIASDWKYNSEFVVPGKTGVIIENCNAERLAEELINIAAAPEKWNSMRLSSLKESEKYKPDIAARPLIDRING